MSELKNDNIYTIGEVDFSKKSFVDDSLVLLRNVFPHTVFSKEWWDWKYLRNPFGKPLGWFTECNHELVGLRLLIPNRFRIGDDIFTGYQLVDTATHPDHGRKGIFSAMTKKAIEKIETENSFFFNFPNENSLPGYIALGWRQISDMNWYFSITGYGSLFRKFKEGSFKIPVMSQKKFMYNACTDWNEASMNWRFATHPFNKYYSFNGSDKEFMIYKIRIVKNIKTAVIMLGQSADYKILCSEFLKYLAINGITAVMYNGLNSGIIDFFSSRFIVLRSASKMHYTTRNVPSRLNGKLLFELADTDSY
ncbi:MAG TPA: GNAT family N-acetyltransferase [bacterium]|nr:GNAT family N-acetyltransferase [bacterium]HPS28793.1 GNAT family N-acetyltransferase [bacterium]